MCPGPATASPTSAEIEEFLTGVRKQPRPDRVLATILVTDLVASTERAAASGDEAWRELMARHDALVADQLRRFGGHEVKHTGDGILATFDGPARAIRCAAAIVRAAREELDLDVRAGLHTGEVEVVGADLRGLAVHIAARICAEGGPGEVLVSQTMKELVIGSDVALAHHAHPKAQGRAGRVVALRRARCRIDVCTQGPAQSSPAWRPALTRPRPTRATRRSEGDRSGASRCPASHGAPAEGHRIGPHPLDRASRWPCLR